MPNCHQEMIGLAIIIGIFMLIILALSIIVIVSNNKHRKSLEQLSYYQINTSAQIDSSIPELLSLVVTDAFNDYQITHLLPLEEGYINSEREAIIRKELASMVTGRISKAVIDKMSLFYNPSNIGMVLGDKIYITVMNYCIEHNTGFTPENSNK